MSAYRRAAETASTRGNYSFSSMVATPEYLAEARLRSDSAGSGAVLDSMEAVYRGAFYVTLRIVPMGQDDLPGARTDVLGEVLAGGRSAFAGRLDRLQNGMDQVCHLELSDGSTVPPSAYSLDRGWGLRNDVNFLFAFPKRWNEKDLDPVGAWFVIHEFGLNIGNIRHALKATPRMRLKV